MAILLCMAHFIINADTTYQQLATLAQEVARVCDTVPSQAQASPFDRLLDADCQDKLNRKTPDFIEVWSQKLNANIRLPRAGWNHWTPERIREVHQMLQYGFDCIDRGGCNGQLESDGDLSDIPLNTRHKPLNLKANSDWKDQGIASYYGKGDIFAGRQTAYGPIYDPEKFTLAHKTLPPGTVLEVTHKDKKTGITRSALAVVADKGPYVGDRKVDLSPALFAYLMGEKELPAKNPGLLKVSLRVPTLAEPAARIEKPALAPIFMAQADRPSLFTRLARWLRII